jgi:membrane protein
LFVVGKQAIGWYLGTAAIGSMYGAAGSLAALLTWVFYSALILLFGAELTESWARLSGDSGQPEKGAHRVAHSD